jgi:DNA-binding NarL/FixJ family response regulator
MISIIIADDHQMFREGLASLLVNEKEIEIIGQASTGKEVLSLFQKTVPDILLLDIEMPKMDGFDTLRELKKLNVTTKVLVLTMHKSAEFIKNMLKAGAAGYLPKDAGKEALLKAVHEVIEKGSYYTPDTSRLILESFQEKNNNCQISPREKEIIKLLTDGLTTKKIAAKLFISPHTVETHRQNILLKLGLKNTAELVKYAIQKGLL